MLTEQQQQRFDELQAKIKEVKYMKLSMPERNEYQELKSLSVQTELPPETPAPSDILTSSLPFLGNRRELLMAAFNELSDSDSRSGLGQVIATAGLEELPQLDFMSLIFHHVKDGDARYIIRKHLNLL
ncbi:MAG: hypothetical protein A4E53_01714 [Pelotomaculum sp. PtaB.Bin104]|nr:MAG: hypothetical protein A4E53_01714 [Pelotomaculum sp. PtaB.Bin104]